ncbi:MFS transporter [Leptolyngbya sp. FACHB-17]|uniref:MFS transporter n=1 Tax=unclassified Leptolyngbya TaxID=2650499 RepID=UPI0016812276|nr:MFS transporter [Leptolyngbya sp. FACHB-17]MBD2082147.1 MFS transporter [Leptolyngbya sp. FACHB-17]
MGFLPRLQHQVWLLAFGRLLSQVGTGFTLFYAPIFFVNQVGLSATSVGIGIGSAAVSGVVGRALGGTFADSKFWGRRRTLLLSALISAIASFALAIAYDFPTFVLGNLLMGLGTGTYWPATEAVVADLTTPEQRNEAYSITRLSDALGLGIGVVLGGLLISATGLYRALFVIDGISFLVFFVVIYWLIKETNRSISPHSQWSGWKIALSDRRLMIFAIVNTMFTTYIVQIDSALPLYLTNIVRIAPDKGFEPTTISALYTGYLTLSVLAQLPIARFLNRFSRTQVLMISAGFWAAAFALVWATGAVAQTHLGWAIATFVMLAFAIVTYMPSAASLVVDIAPESLRGVYLAVNSQCWALGYFIGPPIGGWALDQTRTIASGYWLGLVATVAIAVLILQVLDKMVRHSPSA